MADRIMGVYTIRNTVTGQVYVGSSSDTAKRWQRHRNCLARGAHENAALGRDWREHGAEAFTFAVIDVIADAADAGPLIEAEQRWIDRYQGEGVPLYNRMPPRLHPLAGQATLVPGFMPLADAWPLLISTGVSGGRNHFTVHHFPELGWGRRRFIAIAELEAFIAAERERAA